MSIQTQNLDTEHLVALDIAHHVHPFTNQEELAQEGGERIITHADKSWIWDSRGCKILDGLARCLTHQQDRVTRGSILGANNGA